MHLLNVLSNPIITVSKPCFKIQKYLTFSQVLIFLFFFITLKCDLYFMNLCFSLTNYVDFGGCRSIFCSLFDFSASILEPYFNLKDKEEYLVGTSLLSKKISVQYKTNSIILLQSEKGVRLKKFRYFNTQVYVNVNLWNNYLVLFQF